METAQLTDKQKLASAYNAATECVRVVRNVLIWAGAPASWNESRTTREAIMEELRSGRTWQILWCYLVSGTAWDYQQRIFAAKD